MLVSLLLLVKTARSNIQDSLSMVSGYVLSCMSNISLIHAALVSGLSSSSSSPGYCPLPASPQDPCHILPILCPNAAVASLPSRAPLPHSPSNFPGSVLQGGPLYAACIHPGPLLSDCPFLPRCQALPLAKHWFLCVVMPVYSVSLLTIHWGQDCFFNWCVPSVCTYEY